MNRNTNAYIYIYADITTNNCLNDFLCSSLCDCILGTLRDHKKPHITTIVAKEKKEAKKEKINLGERKEGVGAIVLYRCIYVSPFFYFHICMVLIYIHKLKYGVYFSLFYIYIYM